MNARRLVICAFTLAVLPLITRAGVLPFESHRRESQNLASDSPELNPAPQATVTIQGQKDPRIELWFIAAYSTTADACRTRTLGQSLWGSPRIPQTVEDYVRVPAGEASFSVRLFLDKYRPVRCGWTPIAINDAEFLPEEASGPGAMSGFAVRDGGTDHKSFTYRCRRVVNLPRGEPQFLLRCMSSGASLRDSSGLSINGGIVDVEMQLAPEPPVPAVPSKASAN